MTVDILSGIAGTILSLLFSYFPGLSEKYDPLAPTKKRLIMLGLLVLTALGLFGLACIEAPFNLGVTCTKAGAWELLRLFGLAAITNQTTYLLTKPAEKQLPSIQPK